MRWQLKAAAQKGLALLPEQATERLNYVLQRHVSRTLPTRPAQFLLHFDQALVHMRNLERFGAPAGQGLGDVRAYEFGAGWDLVGPLSLYALGIDRQLVVDIRALVRWELVNHVIALFAQHHEELERRAGRRLRSTGTAPIESAQALRLSFGIDYRAPIDARSTGLPERTFDLISNTFTLEHIPPAEIPELLRESARLLSPTGVLSCSIDMQDHYAYTDPTVSVYNFLRYSDRAWGLINSKPHYQNRLRARDYLRLFERAGLRVLDTQIAPASLSERERLSALPLSRRFALDYTRGELEAATMVVAAARSPR